MPHELYILFIILAAGLYVTRHDLKAMGMVLGFVGLITLVCYLIMRS